MRFQRGFSTSSTAAILLISCIWLGGCADNPFATQIAQSISSNLSCPNFSESLTESLSKVLIEDQDLPTPQELRRALWRQSLNLHDSKASKKDELIEKLIELYLALTEGTTQSLKIKTRQELLAALIALEIGDRTTPEKAVLQKEISELYQKFQALSKELGAACNPPVPDQPRDGLADNNSGQSDKSDQGIIPPLLPNPQPPDEPSLQKLHPITLGGQRVVHTAYQNCALQDIPAINHSTPSVQGIQILGTHSNGVGLMRNIQNLNLVRSTHPYVREGVQTLSSCFQVPDNPLIYDYGGKPFAKASINSSLDLFRNAGSGTSALGIDCSAFVFSALAVQGLRIARNTRLRADRVYGVSASMMMNPSRNGLTCLREIDSHEPNLIEDGDILASSGHVVIIELAHSNPFGLDRIKELRDCTLARFHPRHFDFTILHSSPIKGGIGLNRTVARDYFSANSSMGLALAHYGVAACRKKFNQAYSFPSSMPARVVRHRMTADCLDKPIPLERESCVQSCYQRTPTLASAYKSL